MSQDNSPDEVRERQQGQTRGKHVAEDANAANKPKQAKGAKGSKHPANQRAGLVQKPPGE